VSFDGAITHAQDGFDYSSLLALIDETPIGELLDESDVSVRLGRVLCLRHLRDMPLQRFVRTRPAVEAWMLRQPNCGRRSVQELNQLLAGHIKKQLGCAGISSSMMAMATLTLLGVSEAREARAVASPPPDWTAEGFIDWSISLLDERRQDILRRRFGLGVPEETLEEVGQTYNVTRERIRQLEAKALKELSGLGKKHRLQEALDLRRPAVWDFMRQGAEFLTRTQLYERQRDLDPRFRLALKIIGSDFARWIGRYAPAVGGGWIDPSLDAATVKAVARDLRHYVREHALPRPLSDVEKGVSPAGVAAAARLLLGWILERGYVYHKSPSVRLRRATLAHAILGNAGRPLDVLELLQLYHAHAPNDRCSDRDLLIVMEAAAHLFVEIWEGRWASVGPAPHPPKPVAAVQELTAPVASGEGTITAALEGLLSRTGPLRVSDLIAEARFELPAGRSAHSVGPILLFNPTRFVRLLPGVYALREQQPSEKELLQACDLSYLLNDHQARLFAMARRAGEPRGRFPLWSPAAEMRLCRWARTNAEPINFRSLLAVASPEDWPCDSSDKAAWLDLKVRYGRYDLERAPPQRLVRPTLDRLFAIAIELRSGGAIGFMSVNRSLGVRLDSQSAAGVLKTLQGAGMAEPAEASGDWQQPHVAGARLSEWIAQLDAERHAHGTLDWTRGVGLALAQSLGAADERFLAADVPEAGLTGEVDAFDDFVLEHRRMLTNQRLEEALNELDEDD
jgi:hypothetical protein